MRYFRLKRNASAPTRARSGEIVVYMDEDGVLQTLDTEGESVPVVQTESAVYAGEIVHVTNDNSGKLTLDHLVRGPEFFDRSDLDGPVLLESGIYAFCINAQCESLTAGGWVSLEFVSSFLGMVQTAANQTFHPERVVSLTPVMEVEAGDSFEIRCINEDGAASRGFFLASMVVTKLPS